MSGREMRITKITIGERRRAAMGDITGLARSIRKYGLLHPIVVDDQGNLVAGGRRLAACEQLGWTDVPVTRLGDLTEKQLREIELEENLQRKALTAYERSLTLTQLRQAAQAAAEAETRPKSGQVSRNGKRGPAPTPGSYRDIEQRTGIARSTQKDAEAHVALAERYPQVQARHWKQSQVMALDEALEPLTEREQDLTMEIAANTQKPDQVVEIARNIASKSDAERKQIWTQWASDDDRQRSRAITTAAAKPPMPDRRRTSLSDVVHALRYCITLEPTSPLVPRFQELINLADQLRKEIA